MIFAAENPRGPGVIPWRVCVPIRARSKGALDRRLPRDPRLRLPPSSSSRDWYLTDSLGSRATLRFGSLRACSSDGGTFEPGSPDAEEPFGADDAEAPIGSSSSLLPAQAMAIPDLAADEP